MRKPWTSSERAAIVAAATMLVTAHERTDATVRAEGAAWYPERYLWCARVWPEHPERVAACLAACSMRTSWEVTKAYTLRVVSAYRAGQECPAVGTGVMRAKAWRVVSGENPVAALNGPKTSDFYRSIIGAKDRPVIDRWAARAAGWPIEQQGIRPRLYDLLAEAYVLAATHLDVEPRYLQATLWIDKRGSGE